MRRSPEVRVQFVRLWGRPWSAPAVAKVMTRDGYLQQVLLLWGVAAGSIEAWQALVWWLGAPGVPRLVHADNQKGVRRRARGRRRRGPA
jgi:hypothetical protein